MNKNRNHIIFFVLICVSLLGACKKNPCKGVNCENGGFCNDGSCLCPAGYEGNDCSVFSSKKFIAQYLITDYCSSDTFNYQSDLTQIPDSATYILFGNFANSGKNIRAKANGNQLLIEQQVINQLTINGLGIIDTSMHKIVLSYTVYSSTQQIIDSCAAVMIRQ